MNVYQLIGTVSMMHWMATEAYWAGFDDNENNPVCASTIKFIRARSGDTDQGFSFLTGRLDLKARAREVFQNEV